MAFRNTKHGTGGIDGLAVLDQDAKIQQGRADWVHNQHDNAIPVQQSPKSVACSRSTHKLNVHHPREAVVGIARYAVVSSKNRGATFKRFTHKS